MLHPDIHKPFDYVLLAIEVGIMETNINLSFRSISKNSEKEKNFIISLINGFSNIDLSTIITKEELENIVK